MDNESKIRKFISIKEAQNLFYGLGYGEIGKQKLRIWCKKYGIGIKVLGKWKIDRIEFLRILDN